MAIKTTTTVETSAAALAGCQSLADALWSFNAAGGDFAYGTSTAPFGAATKALKLALAAMFSSADNYGAATEFKLAQKVVDAWMDCQESITYLIKEVLGYELLITDKGES